MRVPGRTSRASPRKVVEIRLDVPSMSRGVIVTCDPALSVIENPTLQAAGANLRALQILQNADGAILALRGAPQTLDVAGMLLVRAVGEVQPGHVHA